MAKEKPFKIPAKLGACADLLYQLRAERIEIERKADEIKKNETKLKEHLIEKLGPDQAAEGIVGELATVRVLTEVIPTATDWEETFKWMKKNDGMDLVQRRLSPEAVKARWERGITIPGVDKMQIKKLSITKR